MANIAGAGVLSCVCACVCLTESQTQETFIKQNAPSFFKRFVTNKKGQILLELGAMSVCACACVGER